MAIPLDQPVEEITRGVETMKIGGNRRVPESAANLPARKGTSPSPLEVVTLQAHRLGHEHNGTDAVAQAQSPDAPASELGNLVPLSGGHVYVEDSAVEQRVNNEAVEPILFAAEQFSQGPYAGMTSFPLQTGYPALYMDPHTLYPYYMGGDIYNYPGASVYSQNYFYAVPGVDPYSVAYSGHYPYSQYQVGQVESFNATPNSVLANDEGAMAWELPSSNAVMLMPYGYQQSVNPNLENGQWVPMSLYSPTLMDGTAPQFDLIPYQAACVPEELNLQPPALGLQSDRSQGAKVGDKTNFGEQLPSLKGDDEFSRQTYTSSEEMDDKLLKVENKKPFRKQQLNLFYGSTMPTKGSWLRPGHWQYVNAAGYPLKDFGGKIRSSGTQVSVEDPLLKVEVNLDNFPLDFEEAKHFVIKSFSEENVMKSIQYGVWASTANGNKKLDEAFREAQHCGFGKAKGCPVFLYFSVNGSGRFCGVAEMVGAVDYNNTMDFWERNRWCGSFPVKWHFIKDVPHSQLRRIILHNNENKPVTSSRDTQEVNFDQGMHMLSIIKGYSTKSSILDILLHVQRVPASEVRVEERPLLEVRKERKVFPEKNMHQDFGCISEETQTQPVISNGINTALRASNMEVKSRDAQLQVKQNVDAAIQGNIEGSGENNPDKENILVSSVGSAVAV